MTNGDGVRALAATLPTRSGISITALDATVFGLSALTSRAPVVRLFVESFVFMLCTIVAGVAAAAGANGGSWCGDDRRLRPGFFFGVEFVFGSTIIAGDSAVSAVTAVASTAMETVGAAEVATAVTILIDCFTSFDVFVLVSVSLLVSVTFFRFVVGVDCTETACFFGTVETTASAFFATGNELFALFLLVIGFGDKTFAANLSQLLFSGFLIDLSLA